nr:MAG TPA: hypothetical protein [Caudoviricetes sp.]
MAAPTIEDNNKNRLIWGFVILINDFCLLSNIIDY